MARILIVISLYRLRSDATLVAMAARQKSSVFSKTSQAVRAFADRMTPKEGRRAEALQRLRNKKEARIRTLEAGLSELDDQLGFSTAARKIQKRHQRRQESRNRVIVAHPSQDVAQEILYAPDMDGYADPGEVVHVRFSEENSESSSERQVLVVGRQGHMLLGTLISTNDDHADEDNWVAIGSDSFSHGKPSWVRVDRVLEIPESGIRRDGSIMPARRFSIVARVLRARHGWS